MLDALVAEARIRWKLDVSAGVQIVAAERLVATPIEPSRPVILVPLALMHAAEMADAAVPPAPLPGRHGPEGRDPLRTLARLYPREHPVGRFGRSDGTTIAALTGADLGTPLYVAPASAETVWASPWALPWISNRLRAADGCPWDREQTHESLRKHLLEESYEVYDALEAGATPALAEELGDLLLQIVLHAQLAAEEGVFDLADVQAAIGSKIVRRHPHVFGEAEARTASDVMRQWERIKAAERAEAAGAAAKGVTAPTTVEVMAADRAPADAARSDEALPGEALSDQALPIEALPDEALPGEALPDDALADGAGPTPTPRSALDGISRSMPALAASQEMQERAAALGYDWPTIDGIVAKVQEELAELLAADGHEETREELGDLLLVVVNLARRHGIEAEAALRQANDKFRRRFRSVERQAAERHVALRDLSFEELDALWDAAKAEEREGKPR